MSDPVSTTPTYNVQKHTAHPQTAHRPRPRHHPQHIHQPAHNAAGLGTETALAGHKRSVCCVRMLLVPLADVDVQNFSVDVHVFSWRIGDGAWGRPHCGHWGAYRQLLYLVVGAWYRWTPFSQRCAVSVRRRLHLDADTHNRCMEPYIGPTRVGACQL